MDRPRNSSGGFTIAELLIAASITIAIVFMLGMMFSSLTKNASHANQQIDAFRDARAALNTIQRDLTGLVKAYDHGDKDPQQWKSTAYFVINSDASNGSGSEARHLYALIRAKNTPQGNNPSTTVAGDLCAVGYYCSWSNNSYQLLRYFRASDKTLENIKTAWGNPVNHPAYASIGNLYQLGQPDPLADETLAINCWNLVVTAFDQSGNIINKKALPSGGFTTAAPYICDPSGSSAGTLPSAIEVSFKTMSPTAAKTAVASGASADIWMAYDRNNASTQDKQTYDRLIRPHVYEFRTRVQFN